jgi:hypothetical protein
MVVGSRQPGTSCDQGSPGPVAGTQAPELDPELEPVPPELDPDPEVDPEPELLEAEPEVDPEPELLEAEPEVDPEPEPPPEFEPLPPLLPLLPLLPPELDPDPLPELDPDDPPDPDPEPELSPVSDELQPANTALPKTKLQAATVVTRAMRRRSRAIRCGASPALPRAPERVMWPPLLRTYRRICA